MRGSQYKFYDQRMGSFVSVRFFGGESSPTNQGLPSPSPQDAVILVILSALVFMPKVHVLIEFEWILGRICEKRRQLVVQVALTLESKRSIY